MPTKSFLPAWRTLLAGMLTPNEIALIFDLDNTLVMSNIDFAAVRHRLIDMLEEAGAANQPRATQMALALSELIALGAGAGPSLVGRMWDVVRQAEREGLARATLADRAGEVLSALQAQGYRLALLTNNAREMLTERLEGYGLARYLEVVATRDDVPALKPAPDGIQRILACLSTVRQAFMIGDAWIDAQAAHSAGIRFIGVGPRRDAVEARGIPIWTWVNSISELLTLDFAG